MLFFFKKKYFSDFFYKYFHRVDLSELGLLGFADPQWDRSRTVTVRLPLLIQGARTTEP